MQKVSLAGIRFDGVSHQSTIFSGEKLKNQRRNSNRLLCLKAPDRLI
jgi:hypothetical protein